MGDDTTNRLSQVHRFLGQFGTPVASLVVIVCVLLLSYVDLVFETCLINLLFWLSRREVPGFGT